MYYSIYISEFNEDFDEYLRFFMGNTESYVTETLLDRESLDVDICEGRDMTIADTAAFIRALGVKNENDFELHLEELSERKELSIDYLVRLCESKGIEYKIEGYKLRFAFNQYLKEAEEENARSWKEARELCREAKECMRVTDTQQPLNMHKAYRLLYEAAENKKYPPAYGWMAYYYMQELKWGSAAKYAMEGAGLGDDRSMYYLALLYEKGADFNGFSDNLGESDYENAIKWCRKAAMKGFPDALNMFNRFIHEGKVDPQSEERIKLLAAYANSKAE